MKNIPFSKYTSYGNNFVIVDETKLSILGEAEKSAFGHEATDQCFGVGADNLLFVQRCDRGTLLDINNDRAYWTELPDADSADYIFRMFEPDGTEALCCGNGLMCIADYLYSRYGVASSRILTEIPRTQPRIVTLSHKLDDSTCRVNLGIPGRVPQDLATERQAVPFDSTVDEAHELRIEFRKHDLMPYTSDRSLRLSGYLVFTGEPHLVMFPSRLPEHPELLDTLFRTEDDAQSGTIDKRSQFGTWLLHRIGSHLNRKHPARFPHGINVNFARVRDDRLTIEYRCFERGINRETLACGTGALAVGYVARELGLVSSSRLRIRPHRCGWHMPGAELLLSRARDNGWMLTGVPMRLFEGVYAFDTQAGIVDLQANRPAQLLPQHHQEPALPSGLYPTIPDEPTAENMTTQESIT